MTDPFGQAIADYFHNHSPAKLWIHNTYGPKEEMPVAAYFRNHDKMPLLEHVALDLCRGKILDIGACAGSHALYLQEQDTEVTALEISPLACGVMMHRGVTSVVQQDIFHYHPKEKYDTLLLMMNGIGITGTLTGLGVFLDHAATLLQPGGQLIFDSSDVAYVYEDHFPRLENYYGEIAYRYAYKRKKTDWFNWLYIDRFTLSALALRKGWRTEFIMEDDRGQYLVQLQNQPEPINKA
ncbi:MAG: class I SAM-dependent methyltransferase [Bacteroidota bacterium]